jgi:hypothetical protein
MSDLSSTVLCVVEVCHGVLVVCCSVCVVVWCCVGVYESSTEDI